MLLRTLDDCRHVITRVTKRGKRTTTKVPIMPERSFMTAWSKYNVAKTSKKAWKKSMVFSKWGPRFQTTEEEKEMIVLGAQS